MHGPIERHIRQQGVTYTIRNASGGGGRDVPSYTDDGTLTGVLERRSQAQVTTDSAGEEVQTDLELRAIPDSSLSIQPAGSADGYPTILVHPDGYVYRVVDVFPEDSGVTVLTLIED